jgi:hypothetical protein
MKASEISRRARYLRALSSAGIDPPLNFTF